MANRPYRAPMQETPDPREKPVPVEWRAPIQDWTTALRAAGRSSETIRTRTDHLRRAARALRGSPWAVTEDQLVEWVGGAGGWSRETRRSVYASLRGFWSWGVRAGRCVASPAASLPSVAPERPCPRPTPDRVYETAIIVGDKREQLIIMLGAHGLRRKEVAVVHETDLIEDLVGFSLVVHGKGGVDRIVPLEGPIVFALRQAFLAGGGWAFPGRIGGHLSPQRVGNIASRLLPDGWTLHSLRHRCATKVNEKEGLIAAQLVLGHASVATTQRYVAVTDDSLRRGIRHAVAA